MTLWKTCIKVIKIAKILQKKRYIFQMISSLIYSFRFRGGASSCARRGQWQTPPSYSTSSPHHTVSHPGIVVDPANFTRIWIRSWEKQIRIRAKILNPVIFFLQNYFYITFSYVLKEAGDFWWTPVKWRRPFTLGAAILKYNERNFFFG